MKDTQPFDRSWFVKTYLINVYRFWRVKILYQLLFYYLDIFWPFRHKRFIGSRSSFIFFPSNTWAVSNRLPRVDCIHAWNWRNGDFGLEIKGSDFSLCILIFSMSVLVLFLNKLVFDWLEAKVRLRKNFFFIALSRVLLTSNSWVQMFFRSTEPSITLIFQIISQNGYEILPLK